MVLPLPALLARQKASGAAQYHPAFSGGIFWIAIRAPVSWIESAAAAATVSPSGGDLSRFVCFVSGIQYAGISCAIQPAGPACGRQRGFDYCCFSVYGKPPD